jgi:hypothetical protein
LPEADDVNAGTPADAAAHRRASRLIGDARLLLIALWLGGAVFFSFVVAPTAFAVLPTHELAGAVVTRTIAVVNVGGFVVALLLIASGLFVSDEAVSSRRARLVEFVSLAVIAVACGIGHWIVAARMVALRASMGLPIDRVPLDDPARVAFNSLHGYSVALMGAGVLAGLVALLLIGRRNRLVLVGLTTKVESLER